MIKWQCSSKGRKEVHFTLDWVAFQSLRFMEEVWYILSSQWMVAVSNASCKCSVCIRYLLELLSCWCRGLSGKFCFVWRTQLLNWKEWDNNCSWSAHEGLYILQAISKAGKACDQVALVHDMSFRPELAANVHVNGIQNMIWNGIIDGIRADVLKDTRICKACILGKAKRFPISKSRVPLSPNVLEMIHEDVCRKLPVQF